MTDRLDCVVVGAGVVGLAVARSLALAGREVVVLEAGSTFKVIARNQLSEGTHATPAVANGRLYIRTFNHLMCF